MTQKDQQQQVAPDTVSVSPRDISMSPSYSTRLTADSTSDNDTSEKPVREKLKKTSLASMSSQIKERQERAPKANEETSALNHTHRGSSPEIEVNQKGVESRGRPIKKRSFENLDTPETEVIEAGKDHITTPNTNGHLRKRSRDVRVGEAPKEIRRPLLAGTPVREEAEDGMNGSETREVCISESKNAIDGEMQPSETLSQVEMEQDKDLTGENEPAQPDYGTTQGYQATGARKGFTNQEMRDSTYSPQKKRSRDQFDTEADREQKIPATEEARAHRRSDELERSEISSTRSRSPISPDKSSVNGEESVTAEDNGQVPRPVAGRQEVGFLILSTRSGFY